MERVFFKKIFYVLFISFFILNSNVLAGENKIDTYLKIWDLNGLTQNKLNLERNKNIIRQWFLDTKSGFVIATGLKERNVLRQLALPYIGYYFRNNKEWGELMRADMLSNDIKVKKLSYPDVDKVFKDGLNMYFINKDIVVAIVDFSEKGFEKIKYFYNYVMPYYKKSLKIKRTKFLIIGNIVIDKKSDYKKLKKYFNFYISEGTKIKSISKNKYKLIGMKDVLTTKKSKIVKKAYVDYSFAALKKYQKKNLNNYIKELSDEYPIVVNIVLKKN